MSHAEAMSTGSMVRRPNLVRRAAGGGRKTLGFVERVRETLGVTQTDGQHGVEASTCQRTRKHPRQLFPPLS